MTTGDTYDELHQMFGIGNWTETSNKPLWKARMDGIGKLKQMLRHRRVSEEDLLLAARYARDNRLPITATWRLFELIPEAKRAKQSKGTDLDLAIAAASAADETDWAIHLMNVDRRDPVAIAAVLQEWEDR